MAENRRARQLVTIDHDSPEAGNGGVIPPKETRFKPGQSGNPKGRPKGAETSLEKILEQELERLVEGDPSLGDQGPISRRRRLVRVMLDAVERGDTRVAKLVLDRVWPVPAGEGESKRPVLIYLDALDAEL